MGESHKKAATDRGGVKALVVWRDADEVRVALFLRAQRTSQEKEKRSYSATLVVARGVALDPQPTPARLVHPTLPPDGLADLPGKDMPS